jgi:hypothetical protein
MENPTYLGDAVYAQFDGLGVSLKLNHHEAPTLIYLEPEVIHNLIAFYTNCVTQRNESELL